MYYKLTLSMKSEREGDIKDGLAREFCLVFVIKYSGIFVGS